MARPPTAVASEGLVPLNAILCTEELQRRPIRPPDHETENRALAALARALADTPRTILQTLADTLLTVFRAHSAGLSLLSKDETKFEWAAISGAWRPHLGGGTPRDFGPCGDVLDCDAPLLFKRWERRYPYLLEAMPLAEEGLLIPFHVNGRAVGTIWVIAHDDRRKFDAEDLRQLESLGRFASAAYQAAASLDLTRQQNEELRESRTELAQHAAEFENARGSRRAALNLMEDAIQSRQAAERLNDALRDSEGRYRTLFDLGPVAVYSCDSSGVIEKFNRRAAELWGREPASGDTDERFCGSYKLFRPDGSFMPHEQCPMAEVLSGKLSEVRDADVLIERPDGSRVAVSVNIRPLKNRRGEVTGAINCFHDITERRHAEELQALMVDELNHRVKNTLATVQSIAAQSIRGALDAEWRETFDARLVALSHTHELLSRGSWEGVALRELLLQELEPFRSEVVARFVVDGPDRTLRPKAALALGLTFHELATNAAKYGALSTSTGQVRVSWEVVTGSAPAALRLEWVESGGPPVAMPQNKGFGSIVIERGLAFELDGKAELDFAPGGLVCTIEIPLPAGRGD